MGTAKVEKLLIATHTEEREVLLRRLQEEGLVHISDSGELTEKERASHSTKDGERLKETIAGLNQAISFLSHYAEKRRGGGFLSPKPSLPLQEFKRRVDELDIPGKMKRIGELTELSARLEREEHSLKAELELLEPWKALFNPPADYANLKKAGARFVHASGKEEKETLHRMLEEHTASIETVDEKQGLYVIFSPNEETEKVEDAIKSTGAKTFSLEKFTRPVLEEFKEREAKLEAITREREELVVEAKEMSAELSGLETALDFYDNERLRVEERSKLVHSERAAFIEGWVKSKDRKRLEKMLEDFPATDLVPIEPRKGEQSPVALENPKVIRPYEMLMNLYGAPNGREADPTPFITFFFSIFFALCITDAGYGIVIALVSAYLIWVRKIRGNLIWILFYGGILTIVGGALTASWFGNLPDLLGMPWLVNFRNALTLFDPMKDPMPFLYLSIAAGYFQMIFGIGIEFVDNLRTKNYASALFEALPWLIIFISFPTIVAALSGILPKGLVLPLLLCILVSAGVSIVLSNRLGQTSVTSAILFWAAVTAALLALAKAAGGLPFSGKLIKGLLLGSTSALWLYTVFKGVSEKSLKAVGIILGVASLASIVIYVTGAVGSNGFLIVVFLLGLFFAMSVLKGWGTRLAWGVYGVYSNATGVLGIVLSYVRLMALGMMTGGIATAFNLIAWKLGGVPVVSIILVLVVLAIGHGYNLVMSALGAFVHSLRLQYVEFFPRFFTGGGLRFEPFELKTRYINVIRRT